MTALAVEGVGEGLLNERLLEFFEVGDQVDLRFSLTRRLTDAELHIYGDHLVDHGLAVKVVETIATPYPHTLRVVFTRPSMSDPEVEVGAFLLAGLLIGGLLLIPVVGIVAWSAIKLTNALANNIVPLALMATATGLVIYGMRRSTPARR